MRKHKYLLLHIDIFVLVHRWYIHPMTGYFAVNSHCWDDQTSMNFCSLTYCTWTLAGLICHIFICIYIYTYMCVCLSIYDHSWRAVSQLEVSRFEPGAFRSWFFPSHVSGLGVIEIYMLALAWRWIWWAPVIVSILISEYWAQNRGQIHDMECQKSRCHFFVFARFNYIFSVFMSGSSQIHNLECQRLDNI